MFVLSGYLNILKTSGVTIRLWYVGRIGQKNCPAKIWQYSESLGRV